MATPASIPMPCLKAQALLVVEDGVLGYVDKVCHESSKRADDGHEYPSLCRVEPQPQPSAEVFSPFELSHPQPIGYAIVNPVGGRELIVPHPLVVVDRCHH